MDQIIKLCCEHQVMVCIYLWLKFTCEGFYKNRRPTAPIKLLFLPLPSDWPSTYSHTLLLWGCWWSLLRSFCFHSKKCTSWAISPACSFHLSTTDSDRANSIVSVLKLTEDTQQCSEVHGKWGTGCLTRVFKKSLKPTPCTLPRLLTIFHHTFIILKKTEGLGLWKHQLCLFIVFTPSFFLTFVIKKWMAVSLDGKMSSLTMLLWVKKSWIHTPNNTIFLTTLSHSYYIGIIIWGGMGWWN